MEKIYTSLDLKSQKVAYKQLNNRRGAVVAVEIDTGAIVTYVKFTIISYKCNC